MRKFSVFFGLLAVMFTLNSTDASATVIAWGFDFGTVSVGETVHGRVVFQYLGHQNEVTILNSWGNSSEFRIYRNQCKVIIPHSYCAVEVEFTPRSTGNYHASIQIMILSDHDQAIADIRAQVVDPN